MKKTKILKMLPVILIVSTLFPTYSMTGQKSLVLTDEREIYPLVNHMEILEDRTANLTIKDIISHEWQKKFRKTENGITGFGFTSSAFWVKLKLRNEARGINKWLLGLEFPYMDYIDFYEQKKNTGEFIVKKTGILRPADSRDVSFNRFTFILPLSYNMEKVFYIRFKTEDPMKLDLIIRTEKAYTEKKTAEYTWHGIFFGILLCMLFYNFLLILPTRENKYFYYILVIVNFIMLEIIETGLGSLYIWGESPWLNRLLVFFATGCIVSMLRFSDLFLSLRTRAPWFHRIHLILMAISGSLALIFIFTSHGFVIVFHELVMLLTMLVLLSSSLVSLVRGYRQGRFFFLAILSLVITVIINDLDFLAIIPISSSEINIPIFHAGFLLLIILWSLAISDWINMLRNDIEKTNLILTGERDFNNDLIQSSPSFITAIDVNGQIILMNDTMLHALGYAFDEIKEKDFISLFIAKEDQDKFNELIKTMKKDSNLAKGETTILGKIGQRLLVSWNIKQISDPLVNADYTFALGIDITKERKSEEASKRLEIQLQHAQKMEAVGTLAGGIAHDFNNVLGTITGAVSVLKNKIKKHNSVPLVVLQDYLELINEGSARAADTVTRLFSISKKYEPVLVRVDLIQTVENVLKMCEKSFDKSIIITVEEKIDNAIVKADGTSLEQVLLNLCINASHAMTIMREDSEPWGGTLSIKLETILADKYFIKNHTGMEGVHYHIISISDTGVGIKNNLINKIFDPFFSTKDISKGTGLGLAMVFNIIHQHQGFIDVYSDEGIGSVFKVYIPAFIGEVDMESDGVKKKVHYGEGTILIIDDENSMRRIASDILTDCGYKVITATDGINGVKIYEKKFNEIDIVLLDMSMPKLSGKDSFLLLKKINPNVKVLLASGFSLDDRVQETIELGVIEFIPKPFTMENLSEAVFRILKY